MQMTVAEALGTVTDVEEKNAPKILSLREIANFLIMVRGFLSWDLVRLHQSDCIGFDC